jgi:hypothetical protein
MRLCRLLTEKYQKLIISVNFLHKYEGRSRTFSRRAPISKDFISGRGNPALRRNKSSNLRFSNCSLVLWNGVPISCYRKTTYTEEGDDLVASGYGYDFGDFKSYPTPELQAASDEHKKIAKLFNSGRKQIIAAKTCSDIAFTPKLSNKIKLLILTADGSPREEWWMEKVGSAVSCTCDATKGGKFLINGIKYFAEQIKIPSSIFNELFCTLFVDYGGIRNEVLDVNCCRCRC